MHLFWYFDIEYSIIWKKNEYPWFNHMFFFQRKCFQYLVKKIKLKNKYINITDNYYKFVRRGLTLLKVTF